MSYDDRDFATKVQESAAELASDPSRIGLYVVLLGLIAFYLAPIESGLVTSFKTTGSFADTAPYAPPGVDGFTLAKWERAFTRLSSGMVNSLLLTVPATVLSAFAGSLAAYGLTTVDWKGQVGVFLLFLAGIFIPYQAVLVPLSQFWSTYAPLPELLGFLWGLPLLKQHYGHILALVITHVAYGIPICTLLFRSYYKDMSEEMVEAARLDGASVFTVYRRIILPLSVPMFAVTLIYQFTQVWNDLLFALIIIPSGSGPAAPVTLALASLGSGVVTDFSVKMAGALITALPTLLVYIVFGEQFAKGVAT